MKDTAKMRLFVLRELKDIRKFFDMMEKGVKTRDEIRVQRAYFFIKTLIHHMDSGDLTPLSIELHEALILDYENTGTHLQSSANVD
ncbi:MAG TPA: hypothetical protein VNU45_17880 [Rummeliibacillus sp.]|nr:hypothetical protein [Rummeliibacillus sp.]